MHRGVFACVAMAVVGGTLDACQLFLRTDSDQLADAGAASDAANRGEAASGDDAAGVVQLVASGQENAVSLTTDGTDLYWAIPGVGGSVRACSVESCTAPRIVASGSPFAVAAYGPGAVMWTDQSLPAVRGIRAGDPTPYTVAGATNYDPRLIVAVPGGAYGVYVSGNSAVFMRCTPDACNSDTYVFEVPPIAFAITPARIMWASGNAIRFCEGGTCAAQGLQQQLLSDDRGITALTADEDYVYWAVGADGGVMRREAKGTEATPVTVVDEHDVSSLVLDSSWLYFASKASGVVGRVPRTGGPTSPQVVATGSKPRSLVVGASRLFWIEGSDGSVRSAQK